MSDHLFLPTLPQSPQTPQWNQHHETVFIVPLPHLELSLGTVTLFDGMRIRMHSKSDQRMFNKPRLPFGDDRGIYGSWWSPQHILVSGECVAEMRIKSRDFDTAEAKARAKIERLITTFRLLGSHQYSGAGKAYQPKVPDSFRDFYPSSSLDLLNLMRSVDFALDRQNAYRVRKIYRNLGKITKKAQIGVGRLNRALSRESAEDRIIDLWIGLEAIFSPGDIGEHTFRTALRASRFLEAPPSRTEVFHLLMDSYDLRSDVVHGRAMRRVSNRRGLSPDVLIESTFKHLRDALGRIAEELPKFDASELDAGIVEGEPVGHRGAM